jgi:hypothetical protein
MHVDEAQQIAQLHGADGTWLVTSDTNSSGFSLPLWEYVVAQLGTKVLITEDGISGKSGLDWLLTPRVALTNSKGHFVTGRGDIGTTISCLSDTSHTWLESFAYYNTPASPPTPAGPPTPVAVSLSQPLLSGADYFLLSPGSHWLTAPGGGGSPLSLYGTAPAINPGWWEVFRYYKLLGEDAIIRPFDNVGLQSWNGLVAGGIDAGNIVSSDLNLGGILVPNRPSILGWETFQVQYGTEFATAGYIAPVTEAFVYTEVDDTLPPIGVDEQGNPIYPRDQTLSPPSIDMAANRMGRGVIVLARSYLNECYTGYPKTIKQKIDDALNDANTAGVAWEVTAGMDLNQGNILQGIKACYHRNKPCYVILAPATPSADYRRDVAKSVQQLKGSKYTKEIYGKLMLTLACYERTTSGVRFTNNGNSNGNSVESALKWLLAHR